MIIDADHSGALARLREVIVAAFPDLANESFTLAPDGWDSLAVDVGDRLIFKFPRREASAARLRREARLLAFIRPRLTMPVPDMSLIEGPPLFSRHPKLVGNHLIGAVYAAVSERGRERIASQLALFYAELHALDRTELTALGAGPIGPWLPIEKIERLVLPRLPEAVRVRATDTLDAYGRLPPDPHGETYGFFDGHGWNLAFDAKNERLNGVYDFGDSGIGGLHQEFVYSSLASFDLTDRLIRAYEALTGRHMDRRRIDLLIAAHGLWELAGLPDDSDKVPSFVERALACMQQIHNL